MILFLLTKGGDAPFQPLHPLRYWGFQWWSGPGADIVEIGLFVTVISGIVTYLRHHNCHIKGCWRLAWHPHPRHGHPVCKKHHPEGRYGPAVSS